MATQPKQWVLHTLTVAILAASAGASAHTSVRDEATEGEYSYNALVIGHGCTDASDQKIPVVAQSVVFPTDATAVATREKDGKAVDLAKVIEEGSLAGLVSAIQDKNIFTAQQLKKDVDGNKIGFSASGGDLDTDLRGIVPFRFTAPTIKTDTCTSRLLIQMAVADICDTATFPPTEFTANMWMPANTTTFSDTTLDGIGYPPTLIVNRTSKVPSKTKNGQSCTWTDSEGKSRTGWDIIITPSGTQIDTDLPIPSIWQAI